MVAAAAAVVLLAVVVVVAVAVAAIRVTCRVSIWSFAKESSETIQ